MVFLHDLPGYPAGHRHGTASLASRRHPFASGTLVSGESKVCQQRNDSGGAVFSGRNNYRVLFQGGKLVFRLLIAIMVMGVTAVWGGESRQLCLSCHAPHRGGDCTSCHLGNPLSDRKNIAHAGFREGKYARFMTMDAGQRKVGEYLLVRCGCRRCHVSAGVGNRVAASLDNVAILRTPRELAHSIRYPVANMPDFTLDDGQITELVNSVLAGSKSGVKPRTEPVSVHFTDSGTKKNDIFSQKCGHCHKILTTRRGALGKGEVGPNLTGIFTPYYPGTLTSGKSWNISELRRWLKNPRAVVSGARMQPVILTDLELHELEMLLSVSAI